MEGILDDIQPDGYYGLLQVDFVNDQNAEEVKKTTLSSVNPSIPTTTYPIRNYK